MASWLVRPTPDRAVPVQAIVLRSWARHLTLTVSLSTQVYIPVYVPPRKMPSGEERGLLSRTAASIEPNIYPQLFSFIHSFTGDFKFNAGGTGPVMASIRSRGEPRNIRSRFMLQKPA